MRGSAPSPPPARARLQDPDFALREGGSGETADLAVPLGPGPKCLKVHADMQARGRGQATKQAEIRLQQCVFTGRGQPNTPMDVVLNHFFWRMRCVLGLK